MHTYIIINGIAVFTALASAFCLFMRKRGGQPDNIETASLQDKPTPRPDEPLVHINDTPWSFQDGARVLTAFLLLLSGLVAYWLFRPRLVIFHWLNVHNPHPIVLPGVLQYFFKNYFADLVWCAAAYTIARLLRERRYPTLYSGFLVALPFLSEVAQALRLLPGTFDWGDVLVYAILCVLFFRKEIGHMQSIRRHLVGSLAVVVFLAAVIGSASKPDAQTPVGQSGTQVDQRYVKFCINNDSEAAASINAAFAVGYGQGDSCGHIGSQLEGAGDFRGAADFYVRACDLGSGWCEHLGTLLQRQCWDNSPRVFSPDEWMGLREKAYDYCMNHSFVTNHGVDNTGAVCEEVGELLLIAFQVHLQAAS